MDRGRAIRGRERARDERGGRNGRLRQRAQGTVAEEARTGVDGGRHRAETHCRERERNEHDWDKSASHGYSSMLPSLFHLIGNFRCGRRKRQPRVEMLRRVASYSRLAVGNKLTEERFGQGGKGGEKDERRAGVRGRRLR